MQLLEEHGEVMEQEKLPSIDDEGNQLEVADYVDDIYLYYWVTEVMVSMLLSDISFILLSTKTLDWLFCSIRGVLYSIELW